jgi:hypothetical protein
MTIGNNTELTITIAGFTAILGFIIFWTYKIAERNKEIDENSKSIIDHEKRLEHIENKNGKYDVVLAEIKEQLTAFKELVTVQYQNLQQSIEDIKKKLN